MREATVDQRGLVERARGGDHDAFAELARAAVVRLDQAARLILRDPELARDAVQEALIRTWRDLPGLRDPDRFDAWLHRLTVRACYRVARKERRRASAEVSLSPMHGSTTEDDQRMLVVRDQLERGFRRLSAQQRAVLVLHYYLDLPGAEAAEIMGVPLGTMKSRLNRATQALRAALDAQDRASALSTGGVA